MTPIPVPHRWLAIILGVAFLLDALLTLESSGLASARDLIALPGAAALAVCAFYGLTRAAVGAVLGAVTLALSSVLIWVVGAQVQSIGLENITLTELVAGIVLTVLVVWRATPLMATIGTAALVTACLGGIVVRETVDCAPFDCGPNGRALVSVDTSSFAETLAFGFFLLVGSVGAGIYLRRTGRQRVETAMTTLVRKQWPLAAALAVLALVEISEGGSELFVGTFGGAIAGVCAFFAPKYPLRNALIAAMVIGGLALLIGVSSDPFPPMSFTTLAASMALISYLVRYMSRREATWGTLALIVANAFAIGVRSSRMLTEFTSVLILLFLLGVAVATGWYFRARDRERNQTMRAAVTTAQQGERMALARELHDVVAHHVTGIVVQAQAALLVAGKNPGVAVTSLEKIERSGTEALTAMRTLVGSLRDGTAGVRMDGTAAGQATTDLRADLVALAENFMGPPVILDLELPEQLPHEVGRSVLRLVQESLTNVGKHAPDANDVRVRVAHLDDLHIRVVDNGATRPANPAGGSGGYGLIGMRERVELLGGRFEAGPSGYVGWSVEAWLPLNKHRGNEVT